HKTANVEIREKLAFNGPRLDEGVFRLLEIPEVREVAVLSTCNRVELYMCVSNVISAVDKIKDFLAEFHGLKRTDFEKSLFAHNGGDAVKHVFRVASSLDSMVLGEPQILGQI